MTDINNSQDTMDSSDVVEQIQLLQNERECHQSDIEEAESALYLAKQNNNNNEIAELQDNLSAAHARKQEWMVSSESELDSLENFAAELESYGDWEHGETLIRESYFTEYAEELANDIGAIDRDAKWPLNHIDWEAAANELKIDYTIGTLDGVDYLMRA